MKKVMLTVFVVSSFSLILHAGDSFLLNIYDVAKGIVSDKVSYFTSAQGLQETCESVHLANLFQMYGKLESSPKKRTVYNLGSWWDGMFGKDVDLLQGLYIAEIEKILERFPKEQRFISAEKLYPYVKEYILYSPFFVYFVLKQYAKFSWKLYLASYSATASGFIVAPVVSMLVPLAGVIGSSSASILIQNAITRNIDFIAQMFALRHMSRKELIKAQAYLHEEKEQLQVCVPGFLKSALDWGEEVLEIEKAALNKSLDSK